MIGMTVKIENYLNGQLNFLIKSFIMKKLYSEHKDYNILSFREGVTCIADEFTEWICCFCLDEFSDVCYAINRFIGSIFNKKYIRVIPFDAMHIEKCNKRFLEYGHFRSKRHLIH